MAREKRTRERAHLAQKGLFDSYGKPTKKKIILPPLPTPLPEDVLCDRTGPDFEALYFALYEKLARECHMAEKYGRIDSGALKEKSTLISQAIQKIIPLTNNKFIHDVFNHLDQLISDYFIDPTEIQFEHLHYFRSRLTTQQREMLYGPLFPPYESTPLEPLFGEWSDFTISHHNTDSLIDDLDELDDFSPSTSSYAKITATLDDKEEVNTTKKRPESPGSEETLSATATPPYEKNRQLEDDYAMAKQLSLGLRTRERKNYCEEESPQVKLARN